MNIFGIGPLEIVLIMALALIVFGPERLPEIARQAGRIYGEFRRISNEVTGELQRGLELDQPPAGQRNMPPPIPPPASARTYTPTIRPPAEPSVQGDRTDVEPPY